LELAQKKCKEFLRRLQTFENLSENPWIDSPAVPDDLWDRIAHAMELSFQKEIPIGKVPEWAETLRADYLIDWSGLGGRDDPELFHQVVTGMDFYEKYFELDSKDRVSWIEQVPWDDHFSGQLEGIARLLTCHMESGAYILRIRPEWFLLHEGRIWPRWDLLEKHKTSPSDRMISGFEVGWMHPALRKRQIPAGFPMENAVTHSFAYLILAALTRLPPSRTAKDFHVQLDRFRAYAPELSPLFRTFFRKWLGEDDNPATSRTPAECWEDWKEAIAAVRTRGKIPIRKGVWEITGDSVFGRNKRKNENEDAVLMMDGPSNGIYLAGVADGVSTANIGNGWLASSAIKREFQMNAPEWLRNLADFSKMKKLENGFQDWPALAAAFLNRFFEAVHRSAVSETNKLADSASRDAISSPIPMSSTLVLALAADNRITVGHWGDSRAYLVAAEGIVRLTEDHNQQLHRLIRRPNPNTPFSIGESKSDAKLIRTVGACRPSEKGDRLFSPVPMAEQPVAMNQIVLDDGEGILLCSDGLVDGFSGSTETEKEDKIFAILKELGEENSRRILLRLVRAADDDRGSDNISAVYMRFRQSEDAEEKPFKSDFGK
jgi:serine/threonine protein phosphatase PrpC